MVEPGRHVERPPRRRARHLRGAIHGEQVIVALRYFRQRFGAPLSGVWDRLAAHRARQATALLAAHADADGVEWLPAYAPDLNPEERCNGAVKRDRLNAAPDAVEALLHRARSRFKRLGRRADTLRNCFHRAGLDVT